MARLILKFQMKSLLLLVYVTALIAAAALTRADLTAAFVVQALDWSGFIFILIGCISRLGSFASRGSFEVQFGRSAGSESIDRRTERDVKYVLGSFYYLTLFGWTGGLLLLASVVIHRTAG